MLMLYEAWRGPHRLAVYRSNRDKSREVNREFAGRTDNNN